MAGNAPPPERRSPRAANPEGLNADLLGDLHTIARQSARRTALRARLARVAADADRRGDRDTAALARWLRGAA